MLVLMTCTMMVAAPIMCVGGIIMALRAGRRPVLAAGRRVPVLLLVDRHRSIRRMVPQFRVDADRGSTRVNRVLREQITGIRVVRAFVRERARDGALRRRERRAHRHRAARSAG